MSRIARFAVLTVLLGGASGALGACQSIAGIEDRSYVPSEADADGGAGGDSPNAPASTQCKEYCTKARDVCGGILYRTDEACLSTCALFEEIGSDGVPCRVHQLDLARDTGESLELYCANAGPGGNDACGSNCENYCQLFSHTCADDFKRYSADGANGDEVCVSKCLGLVDTHLFDSTDQGNYFGDTLQCRLVHTTSSAVDPETHCPHADLKSNKCLDDATAEPDCDNFCHLELAECTVANGYPVYESEAQCNAVCNALRPGHLSDTAENTVGCRMYHSYNALLDPKGHCSHTGPGGDGHCGSTALPKTGNTGNCESYCRLLETACKTDFDGSFADLAACEADCVKIDGAGPSVGYTTAAAGDNVQCRLLHVARALTNSKECAAAQGAAPCK